MMSSLNTLIERCCRPGGALLGALFALIVIVPFCGLAFNCGCDWPWRGGSSHCNYFAAESLDKCPWCVHTLIGMVAVAGSAGVGAIVGGYRYWLGRCDHSGWWQRCWRFYWYGAG